uniref:Retrovirus-related Pol polyprotein from transposon TNT 1-94 n=1 Tax=Cajanus cajan TaxID=3821 RepID=A0A151T5I5_CAJCA|nr:Retrovirus-related Pol polyprotein from transposon TNT 1-94 [Cajanus cajan]
MARCLLHDKDLPKKSWAEAASTFIFLLNRLPTKALSKSTPFEAWYDFKPKFINLKVFGCLCFSYIPQIKRDKLDKKAEAGIFVGYNSTSKAYKIFLPQSNKIIVSRDVQFFEEEKWSKESEKKLLQVQEGSEEDVDDQPIRGTRSLSDIYQRCNVAVMEPVDYNEAATDSKWVSVMKEELDMIEKHQTWELTEKPKDKNIIGVKWVYRTKFNADGSVNKHKVRLVVKGYAQMFGVDFS